jgi:formate/nitrite transporter FocA (FNT family)
MYIIPLAMLIKASAAAVPAGAEAITWAAFAGNLVPVIAGNLVGGSVLVALVYWTIYLRPAGKAKPPEGE